MTSIINMFVSWFSAIISWLVSAPLFGNLTIGLAVIFSWILALVITNIVLIARIR